MFLQTSAFQDLCFNYTWPLLAMLLGAWLLGLIFWYFWWLVKEQSYQKHLDSLRQEMSLQNTKISALEADNRNINYAREQLQKENTALLAKNNDLSLLYNAKQKEIEKLKTKIVEDTNEELLDLFETEEIEQSSIEVGEQESDIPLTDQTIQFTKDESLLPELIDNAISDDELINSNAESDTTAIEGEAKDLTNVAGKDDAYLMIFQNLKNTNLKIVEGIGPKIEKLLQEKGINTWSDLAESNNETLQAILEEKAAHYKIHNPKTWSSQAKLAATEKWEELIQYQKALNGGRNDKAISSPHSKLEKIVIKMLGFSQKPTDLKVIEGIGPKIEALLKAAGIENWSKLAATNVADLRQILDDAGSHFRIHNPSSWPLQAQLASEAKWVELKKLQEEI